MKRARARSAKEDTESAEVPAQATSVQRAMSRFQEGGDEAVEVDHSLVAFADEESTQAPPSSDEGPSSQAPDDALADSAASETAITAADEEPSATIVAGDVTRQAQGPTPAARPRRANPVLELSLDALRESGLLATEREMRRIEDQYRRIKRPLLANAFGINVPRLDDGNLIMVASSLPGEGKSFTSFNLSLSIAHELDRTVLLVDADVAKPHISRALQMQDQPGLIDLLSDPSLDLQDVILRTSMDSLRFLPAGPIHRHSTELLASERMAQLVRELSERYPDRVIVFDTPPLIPTTEAQAMAHLMGQIVVVVHAGHTPQSAVQQALETVAGTGQISLILNKTRTAWGEEYGGYGYYGKYGYGEQ